LVVGRRLVGDVVARVVPGHDDHDHCSRRVEEPCMSVRTGWTQPQRSTHAYQ
jgi:hypothetical protein